MTARLARCALAVLVAASAAAAIAAPRSARAPLMTSPGKPTAPIAIDYTLSGEPAVGALLEIAIEVRAPAEVLDLALDARAADGRALLVAATAPVAGKPRAWTVTVLPLAPETSYLSVSVQGTLGGALESRSAAIPVRAGPAKAAARKIEATAGDGERAAERVIQLPAVESARSAAR